MISTTLRSFGLAVVAAVAAATTVFATASAHEMHPGDQSRWSLDFRVRLEQHTAPPVEVHLMGDWVSTIVAVRPGEYDTQLQVADVRFTGDATKSASAASLEDLRLRVSRPFWATYRADGGLLAIHFFRDVIPADRNLLQMIATELQLVQPDSARPSWTAQERDGGGEYAALYVMPQPDRIMKSKLKYVYTDGVAGAPADTVRVAIDQSGVTFSLAPDGGVRAVDGTSRMHMDLSLDQAGQLTAVTEIHVCNLRAVHVPDLIGSLARALPNVTSSPIVTHKPDPAQVQAQTDDRLLEGYTTDSLLAAAFAKGAVDTALPGRLPALFRRRPEAASVAVALLSKNGAQKRLTNALGIAGSPTAIAALATVARDSALNENLRVDAITAFVQMQHPTLEAMHVPADLIGDSNPAVQSAARMMSGTLAHAGRSAHPAEADAIDASLIALYRNTRETRQVGELLGALGNSVGPSAVPVIEDALRDSRVPVRAAAARALRLAPGSEIDRLLATVIASDGDPVVRADAIFAARFRRPLPASLANALLHTATVDTVDYVRSNAVALLRQNPAASPGIPETLARIADHDTNPGIRRQASEALASIYAAASSKP
jgi:HEAT repeat protein